MRAADERGSASIWVLSCCALLMVIAFVATLRTAAVLARHRAESAADLAALAAAGQIGVSADVCPAAARIAAANRAVLLDCAPSLGADGRSGSVTVRVRIDVSLPGIGARRVSASARAGRDAVPP